MPPADLQCPVYSRQLYQYLPVHAFCHTGNIVPCHQCIAMDTHKPVGKLLFQPFQGLLDQHLPVCRANGDIFLIGQKITDLCRRDQLQAAAYVCTDTLTLPRLLIRVVQRGRLYARQALRMLQCLHQPFLADRL